MSAPSRESPRIEPPSPVTVAIAGHAGDEIAYGVVTDISKGGGCVWTDVLLDPGATLRLRMSFAYPPELHTLEGTVAWARPDPNFPLENAYCCGLRWVSVGYTLGCRLDQLAREAVPFSERDRYLYEKKWVVSSASSPPPLRVPSPNRAARWNPSDPDATLPEGLRRALQWNAGKRAWEARGSSQTPGNSSSG